MALRDIKDKITSVKKTAKVTKAMESVSAVKMRKAQEIALKAREYAFFAFWALKRLAHASSTGISEYFADTKGNKVGLVVVSSDKGLAGAINTNLFKAFEVFIQEQGLDKNSVGLITVGKKAYEYTSRRGYENLHHLTQLGEADELSEFEEISKQVTDLFFNGDYNSFYVLHTKFITTSEQKPLVRKVLPITEDGLKAFITEIIPKKGKYADKAGEYDFDKDTPTDYKFEPNAKTVLKNIVPYLVTTSLYYALLDSKASEHSARMVAMKNATDKAGEVAKDLKRQFNKQRQAAITSEISEITSGMETTK